MRWPRAPGVRAAQAAGDLGCGVAFGGEAGADPPSVDRGGRHARVTREAGGDGFGERGDAPVIDPRAQETCELRVRFDLASEAAAELGAPALVVGLDDVALMGLAVEQRGGRANLRAALRPVGRA